VGRSLRLGEQITQIFKLKAEGSKLKARRLGGYKAGRRLSFEVGGCKTGGSHEYMLFHWLIEKNCIYS
jgi:hypothetical protein